MADQVHLTEAAAQVRNMPLSKADLTDMQRTVLDAVNRYCSTRAGYPAASLSMYVGRQPGRDGNRQHTANVRSRLEELESLGLIGRTDNETPTVWVRKS